jgi:hypothetical protein
MKRVKMTSLRLPQQLRDQLKSVLQALSDESFQERVWIRGKNGSPSSLDFAFEVLFDYQNFRDPAASVGWILYDEEERRSVVAVLDAVDALGLRGSESASRCLSHLGWSKVIEAARAALGVLDQRDSGL